MTVVKAPRRQIDPEYASLRDTAAAHGISVSTLKRLCALHADFPQPVRLSTKVILFHRADVTAWFAEQRKQAAAAPRTSGGLPEPRVRDIRRALDAKRGKTAATPAITRKPLPFALAVEQQAPPPRGARHEPPHTDRRRGGRNVRRDLRKV